MLCDRLAVGLACGGLSLRWACLGIDVPIPSFNA